MSAVQQPTTSDQSGNVLHFQTRSPAEVSAKCVAGASPNTQPTSASVDHPVAVYGPIVTSAEYLQHVQPRLAPTFVVPPAPRTETDSLYLSHGLDSAGDSAFIAAARAAVPKFESPGTALRSSQRLDSEGTGPESVSFVSPGVFAPRATCTPPLPIASPYMPSSMHEVSGVQDHDARPPLTVSPRHSDSGSTAAHPASPVKVQPDYFAAAAAVSSFGLFTIPPTARAPVKVRNVYVAGLPLNFTEAQLLDLLKPFGNVLSCRMFSSGETVAVTGRAYGFGLYERPEEAVAAVQQLNSTIIDGVGLFAQISRVATIRRPRDPSIAMGVVPAHATEFQQPQLLAFPPQMQPTQGGFASFQQAQLGSAAPMLQFASAPQYSNAAPLMPQQHSTVFTVPQNPPGAVPMMLYPLPTGGYAMVPALSDPSLPLNVLQQQQQQQQQQAAPTSISPYMPMTASSMDPHHGGLDVQRHARPFQQPPPQFSGFVPYTTPHAAPSTMGLTPSSVGVGPVNPAMNSRAAAVGVGSGQPLARVFIGNRFQPGAPSTLMSDNTANVMPFQHLQHQQQPLLPNSDAAAVIFAPGPQPQRYVYPVTGGSTNHSQYLQQEQQPPHYFSR